MKTITFGNNRETLITTDVLCGHKASTKNYATGIQLMEEDEAKCGWDLKCIILYLFTIRCVYVCLSVYMILIIHLCVLKTLFILGS